MKKIIILLALILTISTTIPPVEISVNDNPQELAIQSSQQEIKEYEYEKTGNITNGGLATEDDENIYYGAGNSLFKMNKETKEKTKIVKDSYPTSIQLTEDEIYYINKETYEIYKAGLDGSNNRKLGDNKAYNLNIKDNKLYFMDRYNKLYITSMNLNGRDKKVVFNKTVNDIMVYKDKIYYLTAEGQLGQIGLGGENNQILQKNIMKFDVTSSGIYFIYDPRVENTLKGLYKLDLEKSKIEKIMDQTPYSFNLKENTLYYNHPTNYNLYSMNLITGSKKLITGTNVSQINIADDFLLYTNLEDGKKLYKINKDGLNRSSLEGATLVSNVIDLTKEIKGLEGKELAPRLLRTYNYAEKVIKDIIKDNMSDFDKVKAVHDYVIDNTTYDIKAAESFLTGEMADANSFTAYGVLINGKAVCQGYAEATQILLTLADVESILVVGEASADQVDYVPHMWNLVTIDGECYMLDTTWDDPVGAEDIIVYDYFMIDSDTLKKTHRWAYDEYPSCNVQK